MILRHARGELSLDRCGVMAIVNRTPDSFYDGGRMSLEDSIAHALSSVDKGAVVLDVGAVKAGPGDDVTEAEEESRLLPLVEALAARTEVPISVETARPGVAEKAVAAGAAILNDVVSGNDALARVAAATGAGLIVMHSGGQVRGRPRHPSYDDVVTEVRDFLLAAAGSAQRAGVDRAAVMIDPGLDFGKNTFHSLALMRDLHVLVETGYPVLLAASRKDVIGETLDLPVQGRLEGSLALAVLAARSGAALVRVHDVGVTKRAVDMAEAVAGRAAPLAPVRGLWD